MTKSTLEDVMSSQTQKYTIGSYLIDRLFQLGVTHVFGVPGDFSLKFCKLLEEDQRISFIGTTREDTAGFAADGYARKHNGLGVVLVTHGVGALSAVNPIAGANAESSPVLIISGTSGIQERAENPLIHHSFGSQEAQKKIFENFTCCSVAIEDLSTAPHQIDQVLEKVWSKKKPGYLEIPRDLIGREIDSGPDPDSFCEYHSSEEETLKEAILETVALINKAKRPIILAGVELHRFGIQNVFVDLVEATGLYVAATIMGKSVIRENHPLYLGVYQGQVGSDETRERIENSDLVLSLGVMFTDINLGMYTAKLNPSLMIKANQGEVIIKHHKFININLKDFILKCTQEIKCKPSISIPTEIKKSGNGSNELETNDLLTMSGVIDILNKKMPSHISIICDTGDCLFASAELKVPERTSFFASAFYTTMGFAVPAALGVNCASPEVRSLIIVGDGAFQMTGTELSTFKKLGLNPIVIVINNGGYETERVILDGTFNNIEDWDYSKVCQLIDCGIGLKVKTAGDFSHAMGKALSNEDQMYVIDAVVMESSVGMRRLAMEIGRRIRAKA